MFNLQQLETLILCVECGSFSSAARRLGKAQSAVSTTIANLEVDTGIDIFDRSTRAPTLTANGKLLYSHAQDLLSHANNVKAMVNALNAGVEDCVTIVICDLLLTSNFYNVINQFYQRFPHTELIIQVVENKYVAQLVSDNEASIGLKIWDSFNLTEVELGLVGYLPMSIAVRNSHPLLCKESVKPSDLSTYMQVSLLENSGLLDIKLTSNITKTNQINVLLSILELQHCWGIVPNHLIAGRDSLEVIKLDAEEKNFLLHVDRVTRENQQLGPAISWFYKQCVEIYDVGPL